MKQVIYAALVLISLAACNKTEEKNSSGVEVPTLETASAPSAIEAASASGMSSSPTTYSTPQSQPVQAATAAPTGGRVNPPHGEPGHLCEYAVGAIIPANGSAPAAVQPAVAAAPVKPTPIQPGLASPINTPINKSVPVGPKPKFNPAHGEPWHDCAIDVGAPLN